MKITLRVWRQRDARDAGAFVRYALDDVDRDATLLEVLDGLNEWLVATGEPPVAFDSDCREGICGACGLVVDGRPHGPLPRTTTCLLPMRAFRDGATVTLESFRTGAFPAMVGAADQEGFGGCSLHGECEAVCPKGIDLGVISRMNRDHLRATLATGPDVRGTGGVTRPP